MTPSPQILVGIELHVEGSGLTQGSALAAEQALWLAGELEAKVTFVHSTKGDSYVESGGRTFLVVHEGISPAARAELDKLTARFAAAGAGGELVLSEEKPWLAIVKEALRRKPDMVVLGKHNEEDTGARLGSVAAKVLRKCPTAVWVVKPGSSVPPRKIIAATDLSDVGQEAIETAARLARAGDGELHVAHAYQLTMEEQLLSSREEGVFERAHERAVAALEEHVTVATAGVEKVERHVTCHAPVPALLALERTLHADLVVMGTVSRGGIPGFLLGNTAEKVLPRTVCSILAVKPHDFISPIQLED